MSISKEMINFWNNVLREGSILLTVIEEDEKKEDLEKRPSMITQAHVRRYQQILNARGYDFKLWISIAGFIISEDSLDNCSVRQIQGIVLYIQEKITDAMFPLSDQLRFQMNPGFH